MSITIDYKIVGDDRALGSAHGSSIKLCNGDTKLAQDVVAGDMVCILGRRGVVEEVGSITVDDTTHIAAARIVLSP